MTEQEIIDANEHLDYIHEEDAGHTEGLAAMEEWNEAEDAPRPRFEKEKFEINDAGGANWYLRTLRNLENEKVTIQAQTVAMLKAVDTEIHRLQFLYEQPFQMWVRQELARRGGKSKTLPLHQGTCAFRTVPASLRVLSAKDALVYAREQGWDVIKTVETLDADGYKKQAAALREETGELLPGIEVVPERENFTIKFGTVKGSQAEGETEE